MTTARRLRFLSLVAACALWLAMAPATAQAAQTEPDARTHIVPDWKPAISGPVDDFPTDDLTCLAATIHAEAASQSIDAKALVGYYVEERAIAARLSICAWLEQSNAIGAYHYAKAHPESWTAAVYFNGDLRLRALGAESIAIAERVAAWDWPGYRHVSHFDSCDTTAYWATPEGRWRVADSDQICFWD